MKQMLLKKMLAVMTIVCSMSMYAESDPRQGLIDKLVGEGAKVEFEEPIPDGSYMDIAPEDFFMTFGYNSTHYTDPTNLVSYSQAQFAIGNSSPYSFVVTGKDNDGVDNLFYIGCDYNKLNTINKFKSNNLPKYSEEVQGCIVSSSTSMNKELRLPDFINNTKFMNGFRVTRSSYKYDPFKGTLTTTRERNDEVFKSMVNIVTADYNGDGVDDLFIQAGKDLFIYSGADVSRLLASYSINNCGTEEVAVGSLVWDFDGDGNKEYLAISVSNNMVSYKDTRDVNVGVIILKQNESGSWQCFQKEMNWNDITYLLYDEKENQYVSHATIDIKLFFPNGIEVKPVLAIAVNTPIYSSWKGVYRRLSLFNLDSNSMLSEASGTSWYSKIADLTDNNGGTTSDNKRTRSFSFGRPALAQAFTDGISAPAKLFWNHSLYTLNSQDKLERIGGYDEPSHNSNGSRGFDRVIAIKPRRIKNSDGSINIDGKEQFIYIAAYSKYLKDGVITVDEDWKDDDMVFAYFTENNQFIEKGIGLNNNTLSLTTVATQKKPKVQIVKKWVNVSNPVLKYVLAVPPFVEGLSNTGASTSYSSSTSQGQTETTTYSNSYSIGGQFAVGLSPIFKVSAGYSFKKSWSESKSKSITESKSIGYTPVTTSDFVVFNFIPVDEFIYKIVECEDASLLGKQFSIIRSRDGQIHQTGMTVEEYNAMVEDAGLPIIDKDILCHTIGDLKSYKHGSSIDDATTIANAFGVRKGDYFNMSDICDVTYYDIKTDVSLTYSTGTQEGQSESTSNDAYVQFDLGTGPSPISFSPKASYGDSESWNLSTTWNESHSIKAVIPGIKGREDGKNFYSYRQVWYRYHISNSNGNDDQDFMVGNWYITEDDVPDAPAGVDDITTQATVDIVAINGGVKVTTDTDVTVDVYNFIGGKMAAEKVNGSKVISLPKGIYIVKAGNTVKKVNL